jgi:hypothetical protein
VISATHSIFGHSAVKSRSKRVAAARERAAQAYADGGAMFGVVMFACAVAVASALAIYAARCLRQMYVSYFEAERTTPARSTAHRLSSAIIPANDNTPLLAMHPTGTDATTATSATAQ